MTKRARALRSIITSGAVVLATGLGTVGVASAATNHSAPTLNVKMPHGVNDLPGDGAGRPDGPGAPALTGTTLTSAVASADAAVPNATVEHTLAGPNSTYVVIMKKADGTHVAVIENSSFVVTSTRSGDGPHPGDGPGAPALTGTTLTSAVASADAAVPSATVEHTLAGPNSTYVVIMKKADGTHVAVIENSSFVVTSTQTGFPTPRPGAMRGMPRPGESFPGDGPGSSNR